MRHGAAAQASRRLHAIDAARGVALAGMIVINVGPTSPETLAERLYLLPYGRASILFVVVAGIGMGLFLRSRRTGLRPWPTLTWRAVLLVLGGLALQRMTDDIGVILPIYGVLFACAPALQRLAGRALIATAGLLTFAGPALLVAHVQSEGVRHFTEPVALGIRRSRFCTTWRCLGGTHWRHGSCRSWSASGWSRTTCVHSGCRSG